MTNFKKQEMFVHKDGTAFKTEKEVLEYAIDKIREEKIDKLFGSPILVQEQYILRDAARKCIQEDNILDINALTGSASDMTLESLIVGIYYTMQRSIIKEKLKVKGIDKLEVMKDLYEELKEIFESDDN